MDSITIALFAIIQAKYVNVDFLNSWAIRMRCKLPEHTDWLGQLEVCQNLECAEGVLREEVINSGIDVSKTLPKLFVGFLYLRLKKKELTLQEFESELIDIADAYDIAGLEIERIKVALPELEANFEFQKLLDEMACQSLDHLRQVEALAI
ncbi:hypothetical protein [Massilia rubra]|uniref:DUF2383 domain-containing protein n=1 Tax=Massilia rubra TaxID=2607910 RepID=A0ABX0LSD8_9BURK|nr:hypothetical protein [Massilia rubra]NHZ35785.1 hypothetical protein [Massilia rubra]